MMLSRGALSYIPAISSRSFWYVFFASCLDGISRFPLFIAHLQNQSIPFQMPGTFVFVLRVLFISPSFYLSFHCMNWTIIVFAINNQTLSTIRVITFTLNAKLLFQYIDFRYFLINVVKTFLTKAFVSPTNFFVNIRITISTRML